MPKEDTDQGIDSAFPLYWHSVFRDVISTQPKEIWKLCVTLHNLVLKRLTGLALSSPMTVSILIALTATCDVQSFKCFNTNDKQKIRTEPKRNKRKQQQQKTYINLHRILYFDDYTKSFSSSIRTSIVRIEFGFERKIKVYFYTIFSLPLLTRIHCIQINFYCNASVVVLLLIFFFWQTRNLY